MQYRTSVLYLATNSSQAGRARITHATYKTNSFLLVLRRTDSDRRPPGYEPDELPTALLRDVVHFLNRNTQNYRFKYNQKLLNVYLLSGVIQNQYWRHLDPAAQRAARAESFSFTRISQFIEI